MTTSAVVPEGRDASASRLSGRPGASAPVVVGASPDADDAVAWALRHAGRHGAPVRLVRAYEPGDLWPGGVACALGVPRSGLRDVLTRSTLTRARRLARANGRPDGEDPAVQVLEGHPVDALLGAGHGAAMLVVGHRGHDEGRWGLGSVALGVIRGAHTPVTVVRSAADDGPVVVGLDGSETAFGALRHGLEDAIARGVPTVVLVARTTVVPAWAHAQVDEAVRRAADAGLVPGPVDVIAVDEPPARALIDVAARHRASLVVVGHRGRGRAASAVLGSVGRELVAHVPLPVTVVCSDQAAG